MATTIPDLVVTHDAWVDVYTETGISVGTAIEIQNKSPVWLHAYEDTVAPATTVTDGALIGNMSGSYAIVVAPTGSNKIWLRSTKPGETAKVSVEAI